LTNAVTTEYLTIFIEFTSALEWDLKKSKQLLEIVSIRKLKWKKKQKIKQIGM